MLPHLMQFLQLIQRLIVTTADVGHRWTTSRKLLRRFSQDRLALEHLQTLPHPGLARVGALKANPNLPKLA